jgi:chaperonin GroES
MATPQGPDQPCRYQIGRGCCTSRRNSGVDEEEKTKGGIIISDTAKEKPMEGKVIAVGPGERGKDGKIHPLDVKAGDRVLFSKWSGTEVKLDGDELTIMKEVDIMGIIAN